MTPSHSKQRLIDVDPQTAALIAAEERRQREKIILIPSESLTPEPIREALGSVFTSIYAEGYPRKAMMQCSPDELADLDFQLASYRRYADRRFYKGTELADIVESLAARRAAECFATADVPAEKIYANVQPLSGAAANLAIYDAFVEPGETVMGMALTEGGHLTHGSQFNVTGKRYRIVSYAVDRKTGKLDYDQMMQLALEHRPKMIIGGFTSYPWQPDWKRFREIADAVGAILLADVAHTAGLIVGGVYPNPIGIADVVSFTTHKTLCGPRGAVILSTDPVIASTIDTSIFPGQQGGPHVNKYAALAAALKLAQEPAFAERQRRVVENAAALADALEAEGLTVAYGGTDTHLLLVDLRAIENETGFVMMGEVASRILDLVGIVCNKNTLPGDTSAANAHGIRLGTPWVTQRGMGPEEMRILAGIIARVLQDIRPFCYRGLTGDLSRGKLNLSVLEQAKRDVRALIARVDQSARKTVEDRGGETPSRAVFRLHGGRVRALLHEATPSDILSVPVGKSCQTYLFDGDGRLISDVVLHPLDREDILVIAPHEHGSIVESWLGGLADGYVVFDETDIFRKVQGPAHVDRLPEEHVPDTARSALGIPLDTDSNGRSIAEVFAQHPERFALEKPYFVAESHLTEAREDGPVSAFEWAEPEMADLKRTPLYDRHVDLGARIVPFAGWEMPVWYDSALAEHRAVRERAGLFDLGHMGVFQIRGEYAIEFLNAVTSNYAAWIRDGESQYAYLLDPEGNVIDDVMLYRRARDNFLLVVNAVNETKDWAWLVGVNEGRYTIDTQAPDRRHGPKVEIIDLKASRGVIDIALQGPESRAILETLLGPAERRTIAALARTQFCELVADGHQMIVARTGYTGEMLGYEIYVGGMSSSWLWDRLIEAGRPLGLLPCGLASRDSLRTESGLPLYGQELAGPYNINPFEAGFAAYVKLHKPFFIGRDHCVEAYRTQTREVVQFETETGARRVQHDATVLDRTGTIVGRVTSCVSLGDKQIGLALIDQLTLDEGDAISLLNPASGRAAESRIGELGTGDRLPPVIRGVIVRP